MIEKLSFGEPFLETRYIEQEEHYPVSGRCLLLNLDTEQLIVMEGIFELPPLQVCEACNAVISVPGKALLIANFGTLDLNDLQTLDALRAVWKSNYQLTHDEKQRGVPYYKSPKITLGKVNMNFCLVAEPDRPSGIHREHDRPIREIHVQVAGEGAVDLLRSAEPGDVFASLPLTAGAVHCATWNGKGEYPWHRYRSKSRCIFLGVSIENA